MPLFLSYFVEITNSYNENTETVQLISVMEEKRVNSLDDNHGEEETPPTGTASVAEKSNKNIDDASSSPSKTNLRKHINGKKNKISVGNEQINPHQVKKTHVPSTTTAVGDTCNGIDNRKDLETLQNRSSTNTKTNLRVKSVNNPQHLSSTNLKSKSKGVKNSNKKHSFSSSSGRTSDGDLKTVKMLNRQRSRNQKTIGDAKTAKSVSSLKHPKSSLPTERISESKRNHLNYPLSTTIEPLFVNDMVAMRQSRTDLMIPGQPSIGKLLSISKDGNSVVVHLYTGSISETVWPMMCRESPYTREFTRAQVVHRFHLREEQNTLYPEDVDLLMKL